MKFHLFNPLSLMKSTRLFRNFFLMFLLLGLGSITWGERYETVFVSTEDTPLMTNSEGRNYLKSSSCFSEKSLNIQNGEIAYIFSSGAQTRPNGTSESNKGVKNPFVGGVYINKEGLDTNTSITTWNPFTNTWPSSNSVAGSNISSSTPIVGPAEIKVYLKPWSSRFKTKDGSLNKNEGVSTGEWESNYYNSYYKTRVEYWDFKASEGFVTFRIVGSEQAPSKKFATVIPENASGNVRIVLEQSTDLINWSSANPGIFPPSTSKRFFRVRSVEE